MVKDGIDTDKAMKILIDLDKKCKYQTDYRANRKFLQSLIARNPKDWKKAFHKRYQFLTDIYDKRRRKDLKTGKARKDQLEAIEEAKMIADTYKQFFDFDEYKKPLIDLIVGKIEFLHDIYLPDERLRNSIIQLAAYVDIFPDLDKSGIEQYRDVIAALEKEIGRALKPKARKRVSDAQLKASEKYRAKSKQVLVSFNREKYPEIVSFLENDERSQAEIVREAIILLMEKEKAEKENQ